MAAPTTPRGSTGSTPAVLAVLVCGSDEARREADRARDRPRHLWEVVAGAYIDTWSLADAFDAEYRCPRCGATATGEQIEDAELAAQRAGRHCRFCRSPILDGGLRVGAAGPGTGPWCCEGCRGDQPPKTRNDIMV